MADEMKNCPFCGLDVNEDEGCFPVRMDRSVWEVRCGNPYCFGHSPDAPTREAAIAKWNRRALSHAAGQEAVETLIEEVQAFADAYPTDVFGPVTDEERAQHGSLITRASASMGRHMGRRFLPKVLALRNPSQPTTSAEVGQDGEQCRAASGFELLELAAIFESCVPFLPPVGQRNITKAVAELRALSRGVPEGK